MKIQSILVNNFRTLKDLSFGAIGENIEVQATFAGLAGKGRPALGTYAPDGVGTFTAWKRRVSAMLLQILAKAGGNSYA